MSLGAGPAFPPRPSLSLSLSLSLSPCIGDALEDAVLGGSARGSGGKGKSGIPVKTEWLPGASSHWLKAKAH